MMVTRVLVMTMLMASMSFASAQISSQNSIVGTWEGIETELLPDENSDGLRDYQFKLVVRITKYDDEYGVRVKEIPIDNTSNVRYWNDCKVTYSDESTINWFSYKGSSYDWDTVRKGRRIDSCDCYWIVSATYSNGKLSITKHLHFDYKDKSGDVIDTHDSPPQRNTLYRQENDW